MNALRFPFVSVYSCRNLYVSQNGHDFRVCGDKKNPCHDINYTVSVRASKNDLIYIEADKFPYIIRETLEVQQNVSLVGYKGTPTIKLGNGNTMFQYTHGEIVTNISISVENLFFMGAGLFKQVRGRYNQKIAIRIVNCSFTNVSHAVVSSYVSYKHPSSDMDISISKSSFHSCICVVHVIKNIRVLVIDMHESSVRGIADLEKYQRMFLPVTPDIAKYSGILIIPEATETSLNALINIVESTFAYLRYSFYYSHHTKGIIHASSAISFTNSTFMKNIRRAIAISSNSSVQVKNCRFLYNYGFGAYYQTVSTTTFISCLFEENHGDYSGGAIYIGYKSTCIMKNCTFNENTANIYGGTVFQKHSAYYVQMRNCSVNVVRKAPKGRFAGEALCFTSASYNYAPSIENTQIIANKGFDFYPSHRTIMYGTYITMKNVTVHCPVGWNTTVTAFSYENRSNLFLVLTATCSSCPPNFYSTLSSQALLPRDIYPKSRKYPFQCFACPYGGHCSNGVVNAQNNFWGIEKGSIGEVEFVSCPSGYCCQGNQCQGYNGCNNNREGILCGKCKSGYSEDTLTSDCVPDGACNKSWFWVVFGWAGIFYTVFFMYMKEILRYLGKFFNFRKTLRFGGTRRKNDLLQIPLMGDSNAKFPTETNSLPSQSINTVNPSTNDDIFHSGFVKIVFFFYQVQVLFNTSLLAKPHLKKISLEFREVISSIFNFRVNMARFKHVNLCPFIGQQPVSKGFFKLFFIFYIIIVLGILKILSQIWKLTKKTPENHRKIASFQVRIVSSLLQTLLLGYSVLTSSTTTLLQCKALPNFGKVLFIDGTISCYTTWQYILFMVLVVWIIPFPLAIYVFSRGLANREFSIKRFFFGLAFPLAFIIQSMFGCFSRYGKSRNEGSATSPSASNEAFHSGIPSFYEVKESNFLETILNILQGPFRRSLDPSTGKTSPLHWEAVLIFRRLALICSQTFILNPVVQRLVMLVLLCLFLFHHHLFMPFSSRVLNSAETISLLSLCLLCSVNTIPAYIYTYNYSHSEYFTDVLYVLSCIETFFLTAIPILIILLVCTAVLLRSLRLFWMSLKCVIWAAQICWRIIKRT